MRDIDATTNTEVTTSSSLRVVPILYLNFFDTIGQQVVEKYYSGSSVDLTVTGSTIMPNGVYEGVGGISSVTAIQETSDLQAPQLTVELNGIDTTYIAQVLALQYFGREAKLALTVLDENFDTIGDVVLLFKGFMSKLTADIEKDAKVTVIIESILADWERPRVKRYNDNTQRLIDPTDKGFVRVEELINKEVVWRG